MNIIQFVAVKRRNFMDYIVPLISFIAILIGTLNYIINPGIVYSHRKSNEHEYCYDCKIIYPKVSRKMVHCYDCEICIQGYDHHCGVIGKCVGKYNMVIFVSLALISMGFILCLFFTIMNLSID